MYNNIVVNGNNMSNSFENLKPNYDVQLEVLEGLIYISFADTPSTSMMESLDEMFKTRAGFGIRRGVYPAISAPIQTTGVSSETNTLEYVLRFPKNFKNTDVAKMLEEEFLKYSLTCNAKFPGNITGNPPLDMNLVAARIKDLNTPLIPNQED